MDIALLHIVLWAPLVGALLTMMFGQGMRARVVALLSTGFTLAAAAWMYVRYDLQAGGTQFESVVPSAFLSSSSTPSSASWWS